jgi:hypothetical protein
MEISNKIALACLVLALPQGFVACHQLYSLGKQRQEREPLLVSLVLLACTIGAVWLGGWMYFDKPLRPITQTVTIEKVVEKQIPCPPTEQKNGPATAHGSHAFAHSGNGDTYKVVPQ